MITEIKDNIFTGAFEDLHLDKRFKKNVVVDVRNIVDKAGNSLEDINFYAQKALSVHKTNGLVIIVCDMGVSRSRIVAISLLHLLGMEVEDAIDWVRRVCGNPPINPELLKLIRKPSIYNNIDKQCKNNKIIIGSKGFVGNNISKSLQKKGFETLDLHRGNCDLGNLFSLVRIFESNPATDIIYSINSKSFHNHNSIGESLQLLKNVAEACKQTSRRLIYISCSVVYSGNAKTSNVLDYTAYESEKPIPCGTYSESKYFAEELIQIYAKNHGLNFVILRACGLYGKGMRTQWIIHKFIQQALNGDNITTHEYENGPPKLEFLYIEDFLKALDLIMSLGTEMTSNRIFNIGSGKLFSTYELALNIVHISNSKSEVYKKRIKGMTHNIQTRSSKINDLGWNPSFSLDDGLTEYINTLT